MSRVLRCFPSPRILLLWCLAGLCCSSPLRAETLRTWSDITGKYSVAASFIDYEDGVVQLRKPDETDVFVPLDKLSSSDRSYVTTELRRRRLATRRSADKRTSISTDVPATPAAARGTVSNDTMFGVKWCRPDDVRVAAGAGQKEQRPVMWFRVLGDLSGFM